MKFKQSLLVLRYWIGANVSALMWGTAIFVPISLVTLNPGVTFSPDQGIALYSVRNPAKYQATSSLLFVELADGRTTTIGLADATIPPAQGSVVKLWRVRRLIFGEYFLIADGSAP